MRNILHIDTTKTTYELGYTNESTAGNEITLVLKVPDIEEPYLDIQVIGAGEYTSPILEINNQEISYTLPSNVYIEDSTLGSKLYIYVKGKNYISDAIRIYYSDEFKQTDNIMVKIDSGNFIVKKLIRVNDKSFCKMNTTINAKSIDNNGIIVADWEDSTKIEYGDYKADTENWRLEIKNTTLVEVTGVVSGNGYASCLFYLYDDTNTIINSLRSNGILVQFAGNGYWQVPMPSIVFELDPTKTYYIKLFAQGYNSQNFDLNNGFGKNGTWMAAKKIF